MEATHDSKINHWKNTTTCSREIILLNGAWLIQTASKNQREGPKHKRLTSQA